MKPDNNLASHLSDLAIAPAWWYWSTATAWMLLAAQWLTEGVR